MPLNRPTPGTPRTPDDDPTGYKPFPRTARDEGSEIRLARWALFYQIIGWFLVVAGCLMCALAVKAIFDKSALIVLMSPGLIAIVGGASSLFFSALLHGAADVIRLLKRANNLPYSGDIAL